MPKVTDQPLVTCVMVTADRGALVARSVRCYLNQTYQNKQLLVIDDGKEDLTPFLDQVPASELKYLKLEKKEGQKIGFLRNLGLDEADGEFIAQWDDDDWYHPERVQRQMEPLLTGGDACCLSATLMHLNTEPYLSHPYIGHLPNGVPGTILHRNDPSVRYPNGELGEDTSFLEHWRNRRYAKLPASMAHMFIRCFHGSNSWDQKHFLRRVRNNVADSVGFFWHKNIRGNVFGHRNFRLDPVQKHAFEIYVKESQELGLF